MWSLLTAAVVASSPMFLKPPSLHTVSATGVTVDYEASAPVERQLTVTGPGAPKVPAGQAAARHTVAITGLSPNSEYRYEVKLGEGVSRGSFWTAPATGAATPFTFAVVGDSRDHGHWARLSAAILEKAPRFVLDTGDNVNRGDADDWRDYFVAGQTLFAHAPVFATRGNHDGPVLYPAYNPSPPGAGPSAYAFDYGNARFVTFDSNEGEEPTQRTFVERALGLGGKGPLFVFQHHPLFSCGAHGSSVTLQTAYRSLFEQRHVAVDFAGHDHDLILWKPLGGVRYVVSGGGGTAVYPLLGCEGQPFAKQGYGFVLVKVDGARWSLTFFDDQGIELHTARADSTSP
jgi:hypothetical protein